MDLRELEGRDDDNEVGTDVPPEVADRIPLDAGGSLFDEEPALREADPGPLEGAERTEFSIPVACGALGCAPKLDRTGATRPELARGRLALPALGRLEEPPRLDD